MEKKKKESDFAAAAYRLLKAVPKGKVTTYKELANAMNTGAYRAIGQVLKRNPYAPDVPCHRVVASDGTIGGFNGSKRGPDIARKKRLLASEGIKFEGNKIMGFSGVLHRFY